MFLYSRSDRFSELKAKSTFVAFSGSDIWLEWRLWVDSTHSRSLERTLGVNDPQATDQKLIADVLALPGVRPLWPMSRPTVHQSRLTVS
jgi:hypothetical protein